MERYEQGVRQLQDDQQAMVKAEGELLREECTREVQLCNSLKMMTQLYIDKAPAGGGTEQVIKVACLPVVVQGRQVMCEC